MLDLAKACTEDMIPERVMNMPEDAQPVTQDGQDHVPDLEHALAFLHHDRVQKGRARQPGHQR